MGSSQVDTTDLYDSVANTIVPGPSLPIEVFKHRMFRRPSDDEIFLVAGKIVLAAVIYHDQLMSYNFATQAWTNHTSMIVGRLGPGAMLTADESKIIVAGGRYYTAAGAYEDSYTTEIYDFASQTWSNASALLPAGALYSFVAVEDKLVAMGTLNNHIYEYDIVNDIWEKIVVDSDGVGFYSSLMYVGDGSPL